MDILRHHCKCFFGQYHLKRPTSSSWDKHDQHNQLGCKIRILLVIVHQFAHDKDVLYFKVNINTTLISFLSLNPDPYRITCQCHRSGQNDKPNTILAKRPRKAIKRKTATRLPPSTSQIHIQVALVPPRTVEGGPKSRVKQLAQG